MKVEKQSKERICKLKTICTPGSDYIPFPSVIAGPIPIYFLTPNTCGMLVGALARREVRFSQDMSLCSIKMESNITVNQLASVHIQNANHRNDGLECSELPTGNEILLCYRLIPMMVI